MLSRDKVYGVLRTRGPSLPLQIKRALGEGDSFMIGAILTELKEAGKIKISNTKRGGSPFYYINEHRNRLDSLIPDLGEKDRRTAILLKQKQILKDIDQDPLIRVSLRQIKDFAVPLEVKLKDRTELFWKYFLVTNEEAQVKIKEILGIAKPLTQKHTNASEPLPKKQEVQTNPVQKQKTPSLAPKEQQQTLKNQDDSNDEFLKRLIFFFDQNNIQIITKEIIRKNSDIELELSIPSAVGSLDYYCKAKNKKKCNDGDLSSAYLKGQTKKLPILFITTGDVTKKAKEMLKVEFKGMVLKQL